MIKCRFALYVLVSLVSGMAAAADAPALYTFEEAVSDGVIDFVVNPWAHPDISADIDAIGKLNPGLVNRLGFEYGGIAPRVS